MFNLFGTTDPKKVITSFEKLKTEGKTDKAVSLLKNTLNKIKNDLELTLTACSYFAEIHKYRDSAMYYKKALTTFVGDKDKIIDSLEDSFYRFNTSVELGQILYEYYMKEFSFEDALSILKALQKDDLDVLSARLQEKYNYIYSYSEAKQMGKADVYVHYQLILFFNFTEKYDDASFVVKQMLDFAPDEIKRIIELYEKLVRERFNEPHILLYLGEFHILNNDITKASKILLKSISLFPNLKNTALKFLLSQEEKTPSPAFELLIIDTYILLKDVDNALKRLQNIPKVNKDILITRYKKILEIDPKNAKANLALGDLYAEKEGNIIPKEYEKVMESDPSKVSEIIDRFSQMKDIYKHPNNIYLLTKAYMLAERYDNAVETIKTGYFNSAITLQEAEDYALELGKNIKNSIELNILKAKIYTDKGEYNKAILMLEDILKISPQAIINNKDHFEGRIEPNAEFEKILSYAYAFVGDITKSTIIIENLIRAKEKSPENILLDLDTSLREGIITPDLCLEIYKKLENYFSENEFPYLFAISEAYSLKKETDKMLDTLNQAVGISPEHKGDILDSLIEKIYNGNKNEKVLNYTLKLSMEMDKAEYVKAIVYEYNKIEIENKEETYMLIKGVVDKYPDNLEYKKVYVGLLAKSGMYKQVIDETKLILMTITGKESGYFFFKAGEAFLKRNNVDIATQALVKALKYDPDLAKNEIPLLSEIRELLPNNYMVLYALAAAYSFSENFEKASEIYFEILNRFPDKTDLIQNDIFNLIKKFQSSSFLHYTLALIHLKKNNIQEAVSEFETSFELNESLGSKILEQYGGLENTDNADVFISKGNILSKLGFNSEASESLLKAFELDNNKSLPILNKLLGIKENNPDNIGVLYSLSSIYLKIGQTNNAIKLLEEIVDSEPKRANSVIKQVKKIVENNPSNNEIKYTLLTIYLKTRDYKNAVPLLDNIVSSTNKFNEKLAVLLDGINDIQINAYFIKVLYNLRRYQKLYKYLKSLSNQTLRLDNNMILEYFKKIEKEIDFSSEDYLWLGELAYLAEDYNTANNYFNLLIDKDTPNDIKLTCYIYKNLISLKVKNISLVDEIKSTGYSPENIYSEIENVKHRLYHEHIREIEQRLNYYNESSPEIYYQLAYYYYLLGEVNKAKNFLFYETKDTMDEVKRLMLLAKIKESDKPMESIEIYEIILNRFIGEIKGIDLIKELYYRYINLSRRVGYDPKHLMHTFSDDIAIEGFSLTQYSDVKTINIHL
ncbi:MAG: hypothetical protein GWP03_00065 [Proteobacteria bacterium]|nr:hypothetical protein [Pseudomonadota bacterium]